MTEYFLSRVSLFSFFLFLPYDSFFSDGFCFNFFSFYGNFWFFSFLFFHLYFVHILFSFSYCFSQVCISPLLGILFFHLCLPLFISLLLIFLFLFHFSSYFFIFWLLFLTIWSFSFILSVCPRTNQTGRNWVCLVSHTD